MRMHSNIPAVPYFRLVKQFAINNGIKIWNLHDWKKAIAKYNRYAERWN